MPGSNPPPRQGDLFAGGLDGASSAPDPLPLLEGQLRQWQQRLHAYQNPLFAAVASGSRLAPGQTNLFGGALPAAATTVERLDPLQLQAQHLQFWRWPQTQMDGAALYFVLDRPPHLNGHLLLYVGETAQADRRWKGEHDCKSYLAA